MVFEGNKTLPIPSRLLIVDENAAVLWEGLVSTPVSGMSVGDHIWLGTESNRFWYRVMERRDGVDTARNVMVTWLMVKASPGGKETDAHDKPTTSAVYDNRTRHNLRLSNPGNNSWQLNVKDSSDGVITTLVLEYGRSQKEDHSVPVQYDKVDYGVFVFVAERGGNIVHDIGKYDGQIGKQIAFDIPQFRIRVDITVVSCKVGYDIGKESDIVTLNLLVIVSTSGQLLSK